MTTEELRRIDGASTRTSFVQSGKVRLAHVLWKMSRIKIKEEKEEFDLESKLIHDYNTASLNNVGEELSIPNSVLSQQDVNEEKITSLKADVESKLVNISGEFSDIVKNEVQPTERDEDVFENETTEDSSAATQSLFSGFSSKFSQPTNPKNSQLPSQSGRLDVSKQDDISNSQRKKSLTAQNESEDILNLQRKTSLTVPNVLSASDRQSNIQSDKSRKDSNISNERENSKISLFSQTSSNRRPSDYNVNYTSVVMPTEDKHLEFSPEESWIRVVIPYLPLQLSVTCLILNVLVPGSGTILSGFSIFCCAKSRVPTKYDQDAILVLCVNTWVGFAQLFTVTFLLVGWFWSLAWGIRMVLLSLEQREIQREERAKQLKSMAVSAFRTTAGSRKS